MCAKVPNKSEVYAVTRTSLFQLENFCSLGVAVPFFPSKTRELKQPRRRRQQERHKFAYLTMKNSTFARFARAFFIFGHLADVLDLSTT